MTTILAILIAGITSMTIGFVWYHPRTFGSAWMRLSGISPDQISSSRRMVWVTLVGFAGALTMASILYLQVFAEINASRAFMHAGWLWLGFVAPVLLSSVLWEQKSMKLYAINAGYWLVVMLAMALELSLIR